MSKRKLKVTASKLDHLNNDGQQCAVSIYFNRPITQLEAAGIRLWIEQGLEKLS